MNLYFFNKNILKKIYLKKSQSIYKMSIACVSGYFDPIHIGHIEYMKMSKGAADKLMVIVNNDEQAILKKGKAFMPLDERIKIIQEL